MMYYWRFWEPWANAMLVVLFPKLWKLWLAQLFLDVFLGLTLTGPKKASKPTILHNRLNKEKTPGRCCQSGYLLPWWLWCTIGLLEVLGTLSKCYVSNRVAKTLVWIENHDWHNCFWMSSWGSPLLDPKKLQNQQFYKIDWIRKNSWSMLPIWLLTAMMIMMCYWRFWEPWANAMLAILLPQLWKYDWHNCFWMSSWGSPLLDPKKLQNQQFYIIDWIRKKLLVDVATLATCCHDDCDVLLEVFGTLGKCYVSNPVAKTLVWIENRDWHNCFWMSSWSSGPIKASKWTILQNRSNKKKLLVDVANLATCCHDDYDVLLEVLGTWANAMLAILLPKLWFGLKTMTGTTVFGCLPGAHPYWTQKSFKTNNFT